MIDKQRSCQGPVAIQLSSVIGVSDALKPHGVRIALEPASSSALHGGAAGPFAIQGWPGSVVTQWDAERVDHIEATDDKEAIAKTRPLAREAGILAGISTGANVVGAHRWPSARGPDAMIVTVVVDSGFKYLSVAPFADV